MGNEPSTGRKAKTTKIRMTSYMTGNDFAYSPGDIAEFDDKEAKRIIAVGGAVPLEADKSEGQEEA